MTLYLFLEYNTTWGESLYLEIIETNSPLVDKTTVPMCYVGNGRWSLSLHHSDSQPFTYRYILQSGEQIIRREWGASHCFTPIEGVKIVSVLDRWSTRPIDSPFYTSAFTEGIFARQKRLQPILVTGGALVLQVEAPMVLPDEILAVVGDAESLGRWNPAQAICLSDADFPTWRVALPATSLPATFTYKFVVLKAKTKELVAWESGDNRVYTDLLQDKEAVTMVAGLRFEAIASWRGAGVVIPVFSLRSENSFGVGEFYDLKKMVDWAVLTGQKIIQILPINDTTMTGGWQESYPYNANSSFALHPQYLHLEAVGILSDRQEMARYRKIGRQLNALEEVDYEAVNSAKATYLQRVFAEQGAVTFATKEYQQFFENNQTWLVPYAAYCVLRDHFGTPDTRQWGRYATYNKVEIDSYISDKSVNYDDVARQYFIQYHLHKQLTEVRNYAHTKGVVLKGDIPIGVSRLSVDVWVNPQLFHGDAQAGAPPDDFAINGQNWGFPTYDWDAMAQEDYAWWRARLRKMSDYFDAYRMDHLLGFFRIWEIPFESVHGVLGHFNPALPLTVEELLASGFPFDEAQHTVPHIDSSLLQAYFGTDAVEISRQYLENRGDGLFALKPFVATQRQIETYFAQEVNRPWAQLAEGLMRLLEEVLFIEDPVQKRCYHPRITAHTTAVYRALSDADKVAFDRLYDDFYYHRHNAFWQDEALRKFPPLLSATSMLACGEDLGMIPACVPVVMATEQILSLKVQRMPQDPTDEFADTANYPYLSVCTTSTHDMFPLRAWWEENPQRRQRFYEQVLHEKGVAPSVCEPWIGERMIAQHLASPSMWAIFPFQDLLAMDGSLRRQNPLEERINDPAVSQNNWCYRIHLTMEQLLTASSFNEKLRVLIQENGR
ncbi:MAG: 4-alpha-glucanotransferase [Alistipes sp.]